MILLRHMPGRFERPSAPLLVSAGCRKRRLFCSCWFLSRRTRQCVKPPHVFAKAREYGASLPSPHAKQHVRAPAFGHSLQLPICWQSHGRVRGANAHAPACIMAAEAFAGDEFLIPGHESDMEIPAAGRVRVESSLDVEGMTAREQSRCLDGEPTGGNLYAAAQALAPPGSPSPNPDQECMPWKVG